MEEIVTAANLYNPYAASSRVPSLSKAAFVAATYSETEVSCAVDDSRLNSGLGALKGPHEQRPHESIAEEQRDKEKTTENQDHLLWGRLWVH